MADEYIAAVTSILHFEGGFNDTGAVGGAAWNVIGDVVLSADQARFGATSFFKEAIDGAHYISTPSSTDLNMESYDFTVEFWLYPLPVDTQCFVVSKMAVNSSNNFRIGFDPNGGLWVSCGGTGNYSNAEAGTIVMNQWQHIAMTRCSGVVRAFVNGVLKNQWVDERYMANNDPLVLGSDLSGPFHSFRGYVDEFRITKGQCRYLSLFTPEEAPFEDPAEPREARQLTARAVNGVFGMRSASIPQYQVAYNEVTSKLVKGLSPAMGSLRFGVPQYPNPGFSKAVRPNIGGLRIPSAHLMLRTPDPHRYTGSVLGRFDILYSGSGRIMGRLLERGVPKKPIKRAVKLLDETTGIIVRSTWSDPVTGEYVFENMTLKEVYSIIAYDYTGVYRAVIASGQKATKV